MVDFVPLTSLLAGDNSALASPNSVLLSGASGQVAVNSNIYVDSTGNIGIGTTAPTAKLDVRGNLSVSGVVTLGGALTVASLTSNGSISGTSVTVTSLQNSGVTTTQSLVSNANIFGATFNTSGQATLASAVVNANITTSTLNSTGAATVSSLTSNGAITGTTGTFTSLQNSGNARAATIVSNTWIHATQNLTVASSNTSTTTGTGAAVITGGVGIGGNLNVGGTIHTFTGQVGIGSTAPTKPLDVLVNDTMRVYGVNAGHIGITIQNIGANGKNFRLASYADGTAANSSFRIRDDSVGADRFTIDTNGLVGIGTTAPGSLFDVNGIASFRSAISVVSTATVGSLVSNGAVSGTTGTFTSALYGASFNTAGTATVAALVSNGAITGTTGTFTSTQTSGNQRAAEIVSNTWIHATQNLTVASSNTSTTTNTGALVVTGGVGAGGNLNVGGTRNLFTGSVGIGTSAVLGASSNVLSIYGTAMIYGNIDFGNPAGGTSGIYFTDGTYQTTSAVSTPSFGAAGTIQFAGAGNTFSGDTANLFWDDTNNRLGLGTQSPAGTLDVRGGVGVTAASNFGSSLTVSNLVSNGTISGTTTTVTALTATSIQNSGTTIVASLNSNTNVVATNVQSTGQATVASLIVNAGTYTNTLNVNSTANVGALTSNTGITVGSGGITVTGISNFTGNINVTGNLNVSGALNIVNSNVLTVNDPIIYLGEGNPGNTFDIGLVGNYNQGTYYHTGIVRDHRNNYWTLFDTLVSEPNVNTGNINWADSSLTFADFRVGNINIMGNTQSTSSTDGVIVINGVGGLGVGGNINVGGQRSVFSGNMLIQGTNASTSTSTGAFITTGGAAIGGAVHVGGLIYGASTLNIAGAAQVNSLLSNGTVTGTSLIPSGATIPTNGMYLPAANTIAFSTASTESMRIAASGYVGIGTTAPNYQLQISSAFGSAQIQFTHDTTGNTASDGFIIGETTGGAVFTQRENLPITFATSATSRMSINADGNVGFWNSVSIGGQATVNSLLSNGAVSGTTGTFTGALYGASFNTAGTATVNALVSNGAVSGTTGTFTGALYGSSFNTAGTATVNALVSNGAVSGTTGTFSTSLYSATFNTAGTATVAALVSNGAVSGTTGTFTGALYGSNFNTAGTATVASLVSNGAITGTTGTFTSIQNSGNQRSATIVSNTWIHATQNLTVASSNTSTTTSTGALVVTGGIGAGGNVNAGGNLHYFGGTVGVGHVPTGWQDSTAVQLKAGTSGGATVALAALGADDIMSLVRNLYWDGTDWRHNATDAASVYQQDTTGSHAWGYAPFANAGNIAVLQQTMALTNTGELFVNAASIDNVYVSGTSESNSIATGAVVIVGGVGIGGNLQVGGNVVVTGQIFGTIATDVPLVLNDVSNQTNGLKAVFQLKTNQTLYTGIVDSKNLEVIVNGQRLSPHVTQVTYPWFSTYYGSWPGYRVSGSNVIIYNAPDKGSRVSLTVLNKSTTKQTQRYPFLPTTIVLGD